jgi:hypothetical protein
MALADTIKTLAEVALAVLGLIPKPRPEAPTLTAEEAQAARLGQSAGAQASREGKLAGRPKRPPAR